METLKILSAVISPTLSLVINKCITIGTVLDEMKVSKIKPLFKKGDETLLNNYRPISLLPCLSKIFERVLCNQLYEYFESNTILTQRLYRFRKNHRTEFPTKHDVKDIIKTFEDYLQVLQTKTSRHQNVNNLEIIYCLRFA